MNVDCFSSAEGRALVSPSAYRVFVQDAAWLRLDDAMCRSVLGEISAEEVARLASTTTMALYGLQ